MSYKDNNKERERQNKRRQTKEYKQYQREYQKEWRKKNQQKWKKIQKKSDARPERKEYISNWQKTSTKAKIIRVRHSRTEKAKQTQRRWYKENPEKVRAKYKTYYTSIKGTVNRLKKNEIRKFKFKDVYSKITIELIEMVNERDKNCVYCGKELPKKPIKRNDIHYDHVNPFIPYSESNIVRCCGKCNQQKMNADVIKWCEFKGYNPAQIVLDSAI